MQTIKSRDINHPILESFFIQQIRNVQIGKNWKINVALETRPSKHGIIIALVRPTTSRSGKSIVVTSHQGTSDVTDASTDTIQGRLFVGLLAGCGSGPT